TPPWISHQKRPAREPWNERKAFLSPANRLSDLYYPLFQQKMWDIVSLRKGEKTFYFFQRGARGLPAIIMLSRAEARWVGDFPKPFWLYEGIRMSPFWFI
ncbi:MAG: hypothetical protein PVG99_04270, partial [Desulfobacteraceae bacterium]